MNNIKEISRVRFVKECKLWAVEILSSSTGKWIIQGEHKTKENAENDRKNWL